MSANDGLEAPRSCSVWEQSRHTTVITAADTVTPDASFTSPLLAIDKHCRGLLVRGHATIREGEKREG